MVCTDWLRGEIMSYAVVMMKDGKPNYMVSDKRPRTYSFDNDETLFAVTKIVGDKMTDCWFTPSQVDAETAFFEFIGGRDFIEDEDMMAAEWKDSLKTVRVEYKQIA